MHPNREQPIFEDRYDAGRKLAGELRQYKGQSVVVMAIPNGGVPVALEVAVSLEAELDLVISRKIPLPLSPEAGFGAVTDDGTVILNEELVKEVGLTEHQINYEVNVVRSNIRQRTLLYQKYRPPTSVDGRTVIIVDDGLASGFTMMAAVESTRYRRPKEIVVAVPVASAMAAKRVDKVADRLVTCATGFMPRFAVAGFYRSWHDPSDNEVLQCLKEWRMRRLESNIEPLPDR